MHGDVGVHLRLHLSWLTSSYLSSLSLLSVCLQRVPLLSVSLQCLLSVCSSYLSSVSPLLALKRVSSVCLFCLSVCLVLLSFCHSLSLARSLALPLSLPPSLPPCLPPSLSPSPVCLHNSVLRVRTCFTGLDQYKSTCFTGLPARLCLVPDRAQKKNADTTRLE
jgi:hypothetical protein